MADGFIIVEREIFASQVAQTLSPTDRLMLFEVIRVIKTELKIGQFKDYNGWIETEHGRETEPVAMPYATTPFLDRKTTLASQDRLEKKGFIKRYYPENGLPKHIAFSLNWQDYEPTPADLAWMEKQAERVRRSSYRGNSSPGLKIQHRGNDSSRHRGNSSHDRGNGSSGPGEQFPALIKERLKKEETDPIRTREAEAEHGAAPITAGDVLASIGIVSAPSSDSSNGKKKPGPRGSLRMRIDTITGEAAWSPWWKEVIKRIDEAGLLGELEHHVSYAEKCADPRQRQAKDLGPLKDPGRYLAKKAMEICKPKKILWPAFPEISEKEKREQERKRGEAKGEFNGAHDEIPF